MKEKLANKNLTFEFHKLTVKQVEKILRHMKSSKSSGPDGISSADIRPVITIIAPVLSIVINRSLGEGIFPAVYKCAKVFPVFKNKGSRSEASNYRPISNLPLFGKCQEIARSTYSSANIANDIICLAHNNTDSGKVDLVLQRHSRL